jgi:P-type Ca2+ transporter type 2C
MEDYFTLSSSDVIKSLESSEKGLSRREIEKRRKEFGFNELKKRKKFTAISIFFSQFKNSLILLLIFAGFLSLILGDKIDSFAIFGIVLINALLGFVQEFRAERSIEALKKISAPFAKVIRDGKEEKIPAKELVPGDIILLEAGDIVPADSRVIEESNFQIDEASLTGESVPSKKIVDHLKKGIVVSDQENMAFMGTSVVYGKGKCIVTRTGMNTEFGKIASSLEDTKEVKTPLQVKFTKLAKQIGIIAVCLIFIVLISGTLQGTLTFGKMVLFALVLAVATIPSALPVIVTIGLSKGANDLAKKNMLIKKLPAAESLGEATIICSDKTGTLTKNQMTVTNIFFDNRIITVSGSGYDIKGDFFEKDKKVDFNKLELPLRIGCLCNNAKLIFKKRKFDVMGDSTEGSLLVLGKKGKIDENFLKKNFSFVEELSFDSDRKKMSAIFKNKKNKNKEAYVKGAPDILLKSCNRIFENGKVRKITEKDKKNIAKIIDSFAKDALRVLALAYKDVSDLKKYSVDSVEKNLIFVSLVGMIDPPRDEVKKAVEQCNDAGIKVMIITGDHALTTKAIAQKVGLFKEGDIILNGVDLDKMSDSELKKNIDKIRIIARALPIQKLRIVEVLQKKGHIVAMTGDGVNDAPALKKADIGISMGITGTDVAKEVSNATLTDDNFATIVNAIEEGRNIYDKMIKSAKYLLSCNAGEIASVLIAILLNFPIPLLPLQILLINMLTDTSPALGLGFESGEEGVMKQPPRNPKEKPISAKLFLSIIIFGLIMGFGTLFMFVQYKDLDLAKAQTVAFTTIVLFQMFAVLSSRTLHHSLKHLNPFSNKWLLGAVCFSVLIQVAVVYWAPLQMIFGTVSLKAFDWIKIIGISSLGFVMMEISKLFISRKKVSA